MNPKLIVIDGKTYHGVEEMPADVRQKYEQAMHALGDANANRIPDAVETMNILADQDKNGVPDMLENIVAGDAVVNRMKIIVDGKEFNSVESLPPEARARYDEAMRKLDANQNGIPDFVEGMINPTNQTTNISSDFGTETPPRRTPVPVSPVGVPDTDISNGWTLALVGLLLFVLCVAGAAGIWYFFLR